MSTLLICDDEIGRERRWGRALQAMFERLDLEYEIMVARVDDPERAAPPEGDGLAVTGYGLAEIVAALERRRSWARGIETDERDEAAACFDDAKILVVDFDLLRLAEAADGRGAGHLTGERVAYLARCYSECGLIVALNQFAADTPRFDLNLTGEIDSFADLNVASDELANPGLWTPERNLWGTGTPSGYRPWRWPVLPRALEAFEARVNELDRALDAPVLEYLGFSDEVVRVMPRGMLDALAVIGEDGTPVRPEDVTFKQIAAGSWSEDKETKTWRSELGFERRDVALNEGGLARVAAARVSHWLERVVLPAQDVLIDAPHLALRYPSILVEGSIGEPMSRWNEVAQIGANPDALPFNDEVFQDSRFEMGEWVSRAAWFWAKVSDNEDIPEVTRPWETKPSPYVFAEDRSRFVVRNDADQFIADVESSFARRYVKRVPGVDYSPAVRLVQ